MRSFKEEYQREMDLVGAFRLDVKQVSDEIHHHKLKSRRGRRIMVSVASVAVFLLVGGVATAMNYGGGLIRVKDNGFTITSDNTATAGSDDTSQMSMRSRERSGAADQPEECSICEIEAMEYMTLQDFQTESGIIVPVPDLQLVGGDTAEQYIHVLNNQVYIRIQDGEERYFTILQIDHRNDTAYAAASAYPGEAANERNYTTAQGYTYKVIDIVDGDEIVNIECAVSLYGRDLLAGFYGYTQEEAYAVLEAMDLGIYIKS